MVKAAYSSGKPALGVGAGNTPVIIDDTADVRMAVNSIIHSKTFDNGMICASAVSYTHLENVLRETTKEATKKVYINKSGNVVVDLGKEIIGGMKVNIESDAKQSVTVHMGEEMNGDNVKYQLSAKPVY